MKRITIPEVIDRFRAYGAATNDIWGSLHIVMSDGNFANHCVEFCISTARQRGDTEGESLARILLQMTRTQRSRLRDLT